MDKRLRSHLARIRTLLGAWFSDRYPLICCQLQTGWRKRQESNLPKTPARLPTGLKPARPTGSGTLPRASIAAFAVAVNYLRVRAPRCPLFSAGGQWIGAVAYWMIKRISPTAFVIA